MLPNLKDLIWISFMTGFAFLVGSILAVQAHADSGLSGRVREVGNMYGAIHDYYYKDYSRDQTRREMADSLWPCFPYEGDLPDDMRGVQIDGSNCPVNYTRAARESTGEGFVRYTRGKNANATQFTVLKFDGHFKTVITKDGADDLTTQDIATTYRFSETESLTLTVKNKIVVSADQKHATRVTDFSISDGAGNQLNLEYQSISDDKSARKICRANGAELACTEWEKTFGPIQLITVW